MDLLRRLLALTPPNADALRAWWDATATQRAAPPATIDRALVGGALADRLGGIAALCATEEGGNHPRAIRTRLERTGDRVRVTGRKKWATVASEAASLLVVASTGEVDGKNRLAVVRVPVTTPGVRIRTTTAPFVPEIPHAEVDLDGVEVDASAVLPGDGYDDYLKPFRTVEDLHVHAAVTGYLIGVLRRSGMARDLIARLLAIATALRGLAAADRAASTTHLALAGTIDLMTRVVAEIEAAWAATPAHPERDRWYRDRPLLQVAGKARAARLDRAWSVFEGAP